MRARVPGLGRVVQVDPIKPTLKAPVSQRLELIYDGPLADFAFISNLRRYALGAVDAPIHAHLTRLGIEPQLFLLRWLRVLFSREFHLDDAMLLWDAVIAENATAGGAVRDFIEAFAVAMLLFVRSDVLAQSDFGRASVHNAHHITGWHLTQETRVAHAANDVESM